jgi:hypothetical protein
MLRVENVRQAAEAPCIVNIDSYIPISFRTQNQPVAGARYIRLGDFETQLLELQFPADSLVLCGFTLVCVDVFAQGVLAGEGPSVIGLPVVSLPQGQTFSVTPTPRLDIQTKIAMSWTKGQVEISLGTAKAFNRTIVHGRVQFLLLDDDLVGLRVIMLTEEEQKTLFEYMNRSSNAVIIH